MLLRRFITSFFAILIAVGGFSYAAQAATLTDVYDQPSSLQAGAASNHKIVITVASAVSEGETITFAFESDFTTSSITEDDVDVDDDGVDLTTAADCTGSEQASVAMSSGTLTVTICSGDGGAIAAASVVQIEIGTNASSSGTGANQITNPAGVGTYSIDIDGTFGDHGAIWIPTETDSDSGASATVPSSGGGGGGGGGGDDGGGDGDDGNAEGEGEDGGEEETGDEDPPGEETGDEDPAEGEGEGEGEDGGQEEGTDEGDGGGDDSDSGGESSGDESGGDSDGGSDTDSEDGDSDSGSGGDSDTDSGLDSGSDDSGTGSGSSGSGSGSGSSSRDIDTEIITGDGEIVIEDSRGTFHVLDGGSAEVYVEADDEDEVEEVVISAGGNTYELIPTGDGFSSEIDLSDATSGFTVIVEYEDGVVVSEEYDLDAAQGFVYEVTDSGNEAVEGAVVIVYADEGGEYVAWDAGVYGQESPSYTGSSGGIGWYVPDGEYRVTASKSGFEDASVEVRVRNSLLAPSIEMDREEEDAVAVFIEELPVELPEVVEETVIAVAETVQEAVQVAQEVVEAVREIPEVQGAATVSKPVIVATTVGSAAVLTSSFSLLPFLQYLFTAPLMFIARRKRRQFGVVYNAITKLPLELAFVRMYKAETGELYRSRVTDAQGRYFFHADVGTYILKVVKQGFTFPTEYIQGKKTDGKYLDVYSGGAIEVTDKDVLVTANIPLDPADVSRNLSPRTLVLKRFMRVLQYTLAISGLILSFSVWLIQPGTFSLALFIAQLVVFGVTLYLVRPRKKKGWGVVREDQKKIGLNNVVVRLFEPKYNKLIETTLTDRKGRYAFLAGPNQYYVTFEKAGYQKAEVRPIDYSHIKEPKPIAVDVRLSRGNGNVSPGQSPPSTVY